MAETLAIRAGEEIKALFNELAEQSDFENKGDFLNRLLVLYQAESMKQEVSMLKPAIETVEALTSRLLEVLTGTAAEIMTQGEKQRQALEEQNKSFEETRALFQERINALEQRQADDQERLKLSLAGNEAAESKADELAQRIGQLENNLRDKNALIDEYKGKNDTLTSIVAEYQAAAAENKKLSDAVNSLQQVNEQQQQRIEELTREQQQQADISKAEQDNLIKSLALEKDAALLGLKQELQIKLEEQQAKHAAAISEYESRVMNLLNLSGQGQAATAPAGRGKKPAKAGNTKPTT